jgi:hypothetical protein
MELILTKEKHMLDILKAAVIAMIAVYAVGYMHQAHSEDINRYPLSQAMNELNSTMSDLTHVFMNCKTQQECNDYSKSDTAMAKTLEEQYHD